MMPSYTAYKKSSFGPAFLFLNKKRREALAVYYTFCRLMDDIADEPGIKERQKELDHWRAEIGRVFEQKATTTLGKDLQQVVTRFKLTPDRFLWLIEGMEADIQGRTYQTFEDLGWYLWRVAGVVGLATLDIVGIKGPKAQDLARALGFGVQLTNIVRDVWEDARLGRVYLPEDLLAMYGLTRADILAKKTSSAVASILGNLADQSILCYSQAERIMHGLPRRKVLPCRIMSLVYRANLAKIERTAFRFKRTVKLSKFEKTKYCMYALFNTFFNH